MQNARDSKDKSASMAVLEWLERRMKSLALGPGDSLPSEREIGLATNASRSSVREALTALKILGIIRSRRKGGITITRDPVVLELRHFFVAHYDSKEILSDVMEFRAAIEWGFGPLVMAHIQPASLKRLREIIVAFSSKPAVETLNTAEVAFHTEIAEACGNRLSTIFAHLYPPIFTGLNKKGGLAHAEIIRWLNEHMGMIEALEEKDDERFLTLLRAHTHCYMRLNPDDGTRLT